MHRAGNYKTISK